jgi:hypothetical protein
MEYKQLCSSGSKFVEGGYGELPFGALGDVPTLKKGGDPDEDGERSTAHLLKGKRAEEQGQEKSDNAPETKTSHSKKSDSSPESISLLSLPEMLPLPQKKARTKHVLIPNQVQMMGSSYEYPQPNLPTDPWLLQATQRNHVLTGNARFEPLSTNNSYSMTSQQNAPQSVVPNSFSQMHILNAYLETIQRANEMIDNNINMAAASMPATRNHNMGSNLLHPATRDRSATSNDAPGLMMQQAQPVFNMASSSTTQVNQAQLWQNQSMINNASNYQQLMGNTQESQQLLPTYGNAEQGVDLDNVNEDISKKNMNR